MYTKEHILNAYSKQPCKIFGQTALDKVSCLISVYRKNIDAYNSYISENRKRFEPDFRYRTDSCNASASFINDLNEVAMFSGSLKTSLQSLQNLYCEKYSSTRNQYDNTGVGGGKVSQYGFIVSDLEKLISILD